MAQGKGGTAKTETLGNVRFNTKRNTFSWVVFSCFFSFLMIYRFELKLSTTEKQPEARRFVPTSYSLTIKNNPVGKRAKGLGIKDPFSAFLTSSDWCAIVE